ncbi:MAG: prolipoprotein diacylglyceryl transferase [Chromatiales bacterium]|nr:prolipoprotein diacylglyceryl transferase [Chromatiales bacterium]
MIHAAFDVLTLASAIVAGWAARRYLFAPGDARLTTEQRYVYAAWVVPGLIVGSLLAGSGNLALGGNDHLFGKSVLGGLIGAIVAAELFKARHGIRESTGLVWVPSLAVGIIIGRIGCYQAGLDDYTYGTPSDLPWAHDFGDGIARHPVQLYESIAMLLFLMLFVRGVARREPVWLGQGFYLFALWYAVQRFAWEFLKPYAGVLGPLNLFHLLCLLLAGYAMAMMRGRERVHA